jgi:hypothetical protein
MFAPPAVRRIEQVVALMSGPSRALEPRPDGCA